ncbi:berberine bridge enzyme-like 1 [Bradysia coprophila]|uniref:berberine bridge enzyme-like 1 n=1 Tax=Bradysia coprophila TaxID=38358 RepID=UPI00187D928D|nr:berberine bridge enzyme-like 1 [Bradysia coprophila]
MNGYLQPMAYLVAENESDIQAAVICCKSLDVHLVARSGGHSYMKYGYGTSRSLVIDLARLNRITIDRTEMSCYVGPGALQGHIAYTLWKEGNFMITTGMCPTVGISGFALGGGYGYFSRLIGLASDNVQELQMVDATGQLITINDSTNEDLFWALRGGGLGGSFGIVTNFKFKMYPEPESTAFGFYEYDIDDFPQFFYAWQSLITSDLSDNVILIVDVFQYKILLDINIVNWNAPEAAMASISDLESLLTSFSFPAATNTTLKMLSYPEFLLRATQYYSIDPLTHISQLAKLTRHRYAGWKKVKSFFVEKILNRSEIAEVNTQLKEYLKTSDLYIEHYGGAINKIRRSATAYMHRRRKILYCLQMYSFNPNGLESIDAIVALQRFYEMSRRLFNHRESYQNYSDEDIPDYLERYYGRKGLRRLIQVKRRVDPENFFRHPQSIPVY